MNVLTTSQPVGEQVSLGGAAQYATVGTGGANVAATQQTTSALNPGSGLGTVTMAGAPLTPSASGSYLVTAESLMGMSVAGVLQLEILLDGVAQPIGSAGATFVAIDDQLGAGKLLFLAWAAILSAALGAAHTWAIRYTCNSGTLIAAGCLKLVLVELG